MFENGLFSRYDLFTSHEVWRGMMRNDVHLSKWLIRYSLTRFRIYSKIIGGSKKIGKVSKEVWTWLIIIDPDLARNNRNIGRTDEEDETRRGKYDGETMTREGTRVLS